MTPILNKNTVSNKIHKYVMWQGDYSGREVECRLDFAAVQDGARDVFVPVEDTGENQKWKAEESWRMDNHQHDSEGGIWVSNEMMLYFDHGDSSSLYCLKMWKCTAD